MEKLNTRTMMRKESLCNVKRDSGIFVRSVDKPEFLRTRVTRSVIESYKYGHLPLNFIDDTISEKMKEIPCISDTTRNLLETEVKTLVWKYLNEDARTCSRSYEEKDFRFGGEILTVRPDFVYEETTEILNKKKTREITVPLVTVVNLTTGIQKYNNSVRCGAYKNTSSVHHNLESLGLLLYGKSLLNGEKGIVRVCFDSLKTSKDKYGDYSRAWETSGSDCTSTKACNRCWYEVLFDKSGKIICNGSFWGGEGSYYADPLMARSVRYDNSSLFKNFRETLDWWKIGKDRCCESTCQECDLNELCHYNHRPQKKNEKIIEKKMNPDFRTTEEQQTVINYTDGICVVNAGPGSGKTQSLALRIAKLLESGTDPENILILSFSKAAVAVILKRVKEIVEDAYQLPVDTSKIKISTFNSLGNEIVEKNWERLGFSSKPELIDDIEFYDLVLESIDWNDPISIYDYKNPNMAFKGVLGVGKSLEAEYRKIRDNNMTKETYSKSFEAKDEDIEKIWQSYERFEGLMKSKNYIDFSDQSNLVLRLISEDEDIVTDMYRYEHIIVDEFQDSNVFQMTLLRVLINTAKMRSLMVVGDDAQAIYGFRGTSPENIIKFEDEIGETADNLMLTINHRSSKEIVDLSNELIRMNKGGVEKNMTSGRGASGNIPKLIGFKKSSEEINYIADQIKNLIDSGEKPEDIAFISFKKSSLKRLSKALSEREILSQFDMPEEMLLNSRVRAAISLAEFVLSPETTKGLMEYLNELYGNTFLQLGGNKVKEIIDINQKTFLDVYLPLSLEDKKQYILDLLEILDDGTDNVYTEFYNKLKSKTRYSFIEFIDYIRKFKLYNSSESVSKDGQYEAVSLVTAHSSKGKEWKYVFGSLSDFDDVRVSDSDVKERIRLIFVLVTRARDFLTITSVDELESDKENSKINRFYIQLGGLSGFEKLQY